MIHKLILSTGKELELTEQEYQELKDNFKEQVFIPYRQEPYIPFVPNYQLYEPITTCNTKNDNFWSLI